MGEPRAVLFSCSAEIRASPERIQAQILDVDKWSTFRGYGPLPGIRSARYRLRTDSITGSRIEVENRDGSSHVEEIVEWRAGKSLSMRLGEFSPPLSRLASHFLEHWTFEAPDPRSTRVTRRFELHPRGRGARVLLVLIAALLKRAVSRHFDDMRREVSGAAGPGLQ